MSKKSRDGSGKTPDDKSTVYFTRFGGRYVNADELLRSDPVRKDNRKMGGACRKERHC